MEKDETAARIFQVLLMDAQVTERDDAIAALQTAARLSVWRRDQSCGSAVAEGRVGCLLAGVVRKYSVRPDGHRQIVDILVVGDFIGLVPCNAAFSLEAVSDNTRIVSFRQEQMTRLANAHPIIAKMLAERLTAAVRRLEDHLLVQARITALEKVSGYLTLLRERMPQAGTNALVLPISRYDIADHLGIAVETVSRAISSLRRYGVISMTGHRQLEFQTPSMSGDRSDRVAL